MTVQKKDTIEKFKIHKTDTGSSVVQVALITQRINDLAEHFKNHKKDLGSRQGLLALVGKRRRLLNYLKEHNMKKYQELIQTLDLRR